VPDPGSINAHIDAALMLWMPVRHGRQRPSRELGDEIFEVQYGSEK
jgi:hypothetical protein